MVLMNNFEEPAALLPEPLRFWNAHIFIVSFLTISIAAAYFAYWLINKSISDKEECTQQSEDEVAQCIKPKIDVKTGDEKLTNFLTKMRSHELQTPPTERSFKAEIARANVRKVRESGVIVESPKSDLFVSPISSEGTPHRHSFSSPFRNTKVEETKQESFKKDNDSSSLRLPLEQHEQSEEENMLNIASIASKNALFCAPFPEDDQIQQCNGVFNKDLNKGKPQQNTSPYSCRVEQWVDEAAQHNDVQEVIAEAVISPVQIDVTPLRGGGLLPPNFIAASTRSYRRGRIHINPDCGAHKLSFSKHPNLSPANKQETPQTKTQSATTPVDCFFSPSEPSKIVSPQKPKMNDMAIPRRNVEGGTPAAGNHPKQQISQDEYPIFVKRLPSIPTAVSPEMNSDKRVKPPTNSPTSLLPHAQRIDVENIPRRGVTFNCRTTHIPVPNICSKSNEIEQLPLKAQVEALKKEMHRHRGTHKKKGTPKERGETPLFVQSHSARRHHPNRNHVARIEDIEQRGCRSNVRKPGRRTEERLLDWFKKMPLDKQQEIIARCSAKR